MKSCQHRGKELQAWQHVAGLTPHRLMWCQSLNPTTKFQKCIIPSAPAQNEQVKLDIHSRTVPSGAGNDLRRIHPQLHFVLGSMGRTPKQLERCLENSPSLGLEAGLSQESHIILLLLPLCPYYKAHFRGSKPLKCYSSCLKIKVTFQGAGSP